MSALRLFPVIARNSSFVYKGRAVDVTAVSRELGVHYVVEGSVRKAGDRVRVGVQLIDATTGLHVWAERYDRIDAMRSTASANSRRRSRLSRTPFACARAIGPSVAAFQRCLSPNTSFSTTTPEKETSRRAMALMPIYWLVSTEMRRPGPDPGRKEEAAQCIEEIRRREPEISRCAYSARLPFRDLGLCPAHRRRSCQGRLERLSELANRFADSFTVTDVWPRKSASRRLDLLQRDD